MENNTRIHLNNQWKYITEFQEEMIKTSYDDSDMKTVNVPHTNVETPYHYFDEKIYQFVSCYRRHLDVSEEWIGKHALLTFEGVGHIAKVYLNEVLITTHYGGYTAFSVDISPYINYEMNNVLVVEVDSREDNNLPPFGNVIDYLTYGGIYREVYIDIKSKTFIEDVFVKTTIVEFEKNSEYKEQNLFFDLSLNHDLKDNLTLRYSITNHEEPVDVIFSSSIELINRITQISNHVADVKNWELSQPQLYELKLELCKADEILDTKKIRFGFRTCEFKEDGFYLNHKKIKLVGLNRHQSYPYVGYAMPKRMQRRDAEILKHELFVNAVRTSHYPQSKHFIDRCDELGLLVFTEIPGWQHIGDEAWKEIAYQNVSEMVLQYRNHPSIILWGVRINESQDDDSFYKNTNHIAHKLDTTRQTGGVRFLKKSSLLEDVYTYNDFLHNGNTKGLESKKEVTSNINAPYLVSEYNGHMYPTKSFDDEKHRLIHALRHACVLDALFEHEDIAGGFGWCMFDYNTHQDFGSGDRICYHGVMDMFRNPKLAASIYKSQNKDTPVCEISSAMDIGDHPGGCIGEVFAFTNADSIKLYKNETFIKEFYPSRTRYFNLPHPPIIIDDFIGNLLEKNEHFSTKTAESIKDVLQAVSRFGQNNLPLHYKKKIAFIFIKEKLSYADGIRLYSEYIGNWGGTVTTYKFEAIKDNKVVNVIDKKPVKKLFIEANADTLQLCDAETYDVSGIRILIKDENDNRLPYYQEPLTLEVSGAIELIGPKIVSLKGGAAGTYVKTKGVKGEGVLRITQEYLGTIELKFNVE